MTDSVWNQDRGKNWAEHEYCATQNTLIQNKVDIYNPKKNKLSTLLTFDLLTVWWKRLRLLK